MNSVSFGGAIASFYKNYATFSGRATRAEYWWVYLYTFLATLVLAFAFFPLAIVFLLANIVPNLALTVRRLHHVGKGGGCIFISCVPFIGGIWLLVLLLTGSEGDNRFGPNPFGLSNAPSNNPYGAPQMPQNPYQQPQGNPFNAPQPPRN